MRVMTAFSAACLVVLAATVCQAVPIPPNVPVSGAQPNLQNEEQVWISPIDTNIAVANHRDFRLGYRQIGLGRTTNGGASWTDSLIRPAFQIFGWQSDPIMTVNTAGRYFISHLDFDPSGADGLSYVVFLVSDDKGVSWSGPSTVEGSLGPYFEDKQFVTCDRTGGPNDGTVYISWTRFSGNDPTRIMLAHTIGATLFWADTVIAGPPLASSCYGVTSAGQFSQPLVGKDGAVYVFWLGDDIDSSSGCVGYSAIRMSKSTDGGQTWPTNRMLTRVDGWNFVDGNIDVYSAPITDADIGSGPHAGNLYMEYRDLTTASPINSDMFFQRSLDTGHTWTPRIRVNDDPVGPNVDQFHNWLVCNQAGVLVSIWYDQRMDPSHLKFDVFAAYSYDGGATWTSNHRVSSVSSDPAFLAAAPNAGNQIEGSVSTDAAPTVTTPLSPMAGKIGEYTGVSCIGDKVVAVWTDTRQGSQDVWSAHWYLPLTDPRLLTATGAALSCGDTLRWATAWKETEDLYRIQISTTNAFNPADIVFDSLVGVPQAGIPAYVTSASYFWRVKSYKAPGGTPSDSTAFSAANTFNYTGCCLCTCHADPVCDGVHSDVLDVVTTIGVAFRGNPDTYDPDCPMEGTTIGGRADVNCSGAVDVIDVVTVINVAFRGLSAATAYCKPCSL